MAMPRQQVTPATTATARPRRSCSGRRYRAPFCSGFAATASWKTRASSDGGGSSCGGRDRRRRPNRRRPEFGCDRVRRCCSQTRELRRWRGSTGRGKHNGCTPVTKWSPGFRRSRARAAVVFGLDGIGGQSKQKRTGVGVNDGGAYRGSIGGPAARGRHRRWRAGAGDLGRPEMGETAWAAMQGSRCRTGWRRRCRRRWRFFWAYRQGEGWPVATVVASDVSGGE